MKRSYILLTAVMFLSAIHVCAQRCNEAGSHWDVSAASEWSLGDAHDIGVTDGLSVTTDKIWNGGFGVSYNLKGSRTWGFAVSSGLGYSRSKVVLGYSDNLYSFESDADVDGDTYMRYYKDLHLSEKVCMNSIMLPLYVTGKLKPGKAVAFCLDLGIRMRISTGRSVEHTDGGAYVYGIYPQYGDMVMNETWGYNGFGNMDFTKAEKGEAKVSSFGMSFYSAIGVDISIYRNYSLSLGVAYERGLNDVFKSAGDNTRLVYNTIKGTESVEHINSLTSLVSSSRLDALHFQCKIKRCF